MTALRHALIVTALVTFTGGIVAMPAVARTVGQVIDDAKITTEVKAKLTAEKISNLTRIEVKTDNGVVTLNGVVDDPERRARAAQIAGAVNGVKGIVNNIHVSGTTVPAAPPVTGAAVDATGIVSHVDPATGTITLQDGRVLRATNQTVIWQPSTVQALRPGTQVLVRGAAAVGVQPTASVGPPEWRMGTVRSVDRAGSQLVLTDGTIVRVAPSALVHRGPDRLALDQIAPGAEVVIRTLPLRGGAAEGSALPGRMATAPVIEASEVNVVWTPLTR